MPRRPVVDPRFPERLRELRIQRGLSFRALAELVTYGKTYLHELETGKKAPTVAVARRLDKKLAAGGELAAMAVETVTASMPRRQFIGAAAGLVAELSSAPATMPGRRYGLSNVRQILYRTARLRRLDDFLGGADTYPMYSAEAETTATILRSGGYGEHTRSPLLCVYAEQAQLAGWAAFDAGWNEQAERMFQDSLDAAEEAGDAGLAGNALVLLAYQMLHTGGSGVELATAATDTAQQGATPRVRALLHERRAWAHAMAGQRAETESELDQAEGALAQYDDRPEPDWVFWVDDTELAIMAGRCWAVLRRPMRAISTLEGALVGFTDTHARDKALYLSWLADAYLDANEPEQAAATVGRVLNLSENIGSVRPHQRVDELLPRLLPYGVLPAVSAVLEEARLMRSATPLALGSNGVSTPGSPPTQPRVTPR